MKPWNKLFLLSIGIVLLFSIMDVMQIQGTYVSQNWEAYDQYIQPAIQFLWIGILIIFGIFYYLIKKDKSEAVAITVTPIILMVTGLEDLIFFLIKPQLITEKMCWFTYPPHNWINAFFGLGCTTFTSLMFTSVFGVIIAWGVFGWLKKQKW